MKDDSADAANPPQSSRDRVLLFIGSLAYLGFVPVASGTVAVAIVGVPLHLLLVGHFGWTWTWYAAFCAALTLFAIWIAEHADRILNEKDSSKSVIDEIPGYLIALVALPITWQIVVCAFIVERAIDIAKIPPANWIERKLPGGWGVVLDDVVAGLYTLGLLHLGTRILPGWFGLP